MNPDYSLLIPEYILAGGAVLVAGVEVVFRRLRRDVPAYLAALVALAAGIGDRPVPAGLDTYRRLAMDVLVSPLDLSAQSVRVREADDASRRVDVLRLEAP